MTALNTQQSARTDLSMCALAASFTRAPWRDSEPAVVAPATIRRFDELAARGDLYGHWRRQAEHAKRLAEAAKAYPRREQQRRV
jgi:hypothetical protein